MIRIFFLGQKVPDYFARCACPLIFGALLTVVYRYKGQTMAVPLLGTHLFYKNVTYDCDREVFPADDAFFTSKFLLLDRLF